MIKYILPFLILLVSHAAHGQLSVRLESGLFTTQYNDVRVPNGATTQGTLFSLSDDFESSGWNAFIRGELAYTIGDRHTIALVSAPLRVSYTGLQLSTVAFANESFGGTDTDAGYQFNTYRASYRYGLVKGDKWSVDLGATLLVRDAEIWLTQGDKVSTDDDLGFAPLVSFDIRYLPSDKLSILCRGDALVGPVGRAEDIFLGLQYDVLGDKLATTLGYRVIEGGADVDQVYNFAYFHFINVGLVYNM